MKVNTSTSIILVYASHTINVKADFKTEWPRVLYMQILTKSAKFHYAKGEFERLK